MKRVIGRNRSEFDRGLGFFDAVYGFAITLLIANIDLPPASAWGSVSELLAHGLDAQLLGFIVSFAVIAIFWKANTSLVGRLSGMDGAIITANLVIAGLVVFIPFSTQGISDPEVSALPLPVAVYAVNVTAAILAQAVMFELARARGLVEDDVPRGAIWVTRLDVLAQIAVFIISIPVAYVAGSSWGMLTWAALLVVNPLMDHWTRAVVARVDAEPRVGAEL